MSSPYREVSRDKIRDRARVRDNRDLVSRDKYEKLKYKAQEWRDRAEEFEELSKNQKRIIDSLKQKIEQFESRLNNTNKLKDRIATLERDNILKDGKIQQLSEARDDLKERYRELKDDYREQQRWNRRYPGGTYPTGTYPTERRRYSERGKYSDDPNKSP